LYSHLHWPSLSLFVSCFCCVLLPWCFCIHGAFTLHPRCIHVAFTLHSRAC
jgi:hypothetical protein